MYKISKYVRWLVAVFLLYVLLNKIDVSETIKIISDFEWFWIILIVGVIIIGYLFNTYRWQVLLSCHQKRVSFSRLLRYRLIGVMYGNILPSSFSGEMARAYYLSKSEDVEMSQAFSTVLVEKMSGIVAVIIYLLLGIVLNLGVIHETHIYFLLLLILVLMLVVAILLFSKKFRQKVLGHFGKNENKIIRFLKKYYQAIHLYRNYREKLFLSVMASFIIQGFTLLTNYFVVLGLQIPLNFSHIILAVPLITISNLIPVSVGNWGWREGVYVYAFSLFGIGSAASLALALFMRMIKLIISLLGLVFAFSKRNFSFLTK